MCDGGRQTEVMKLKGEWSVVVGVSQPSRIPLSGGWLVSLLVS